VGVAKKCGKQELGLMEEAKGSGQK